MSLSVQLDAHSLKVLNVFLVCIFVSVYLFRYTLYIYIYFLNKYMYIFTSYNLFFLYPGGYCVQFNHFPDVPCIFSAFLLAKQLAGRSAKIPRNSVATSATSPSRQIHEKFQRQTAVEGHQASQITLILDDSESDFTF